MPISQWEFNSLADAVERCRYLVVSLFPTTRILGLVEDQAEAEKLAKSEKAGYINVIAKVNGLRYR
jgi:hypothetical protein